MIKAVSFDFTKTLAIARTPAVVYSHFLRKHVPELSLPVAVLEESIATSMETWGVPRSSSGWTPLISHIIDRSLSVVEANQAQKDAWAAQKDHLCPLLIKHFAHGDSYALCAFAKETLAGLDVPCGVLSNADERTHLLLKDLGLADLCSFVLTGNDLGEHRKPHPHAFRKVMEAVSISDPSTLLHVGDDLGKDVNGAVNAGFRAIWIRSGALEDDVEPDFSMLCAQLLETGRVELSSLRYVSALVSHVNRL